MKIALRMWTKNPGFTAMCVLTLALGIGANTAIVGLIDALVFRPVPFRQPDRLVSFGSNYQNYLAVSADGQIFSDVAAVVGLPLEARTDDSRQLTGRAVTGNFFQVLGMTLPLGRGFLPEEEAISGSRPAVVISHRLWTEAFSSDPAVLGKTLRLNGEPLTIVGVAPQDLRDTVPWGFRDLWVPISMFGRITHLEKWPTWREAIEHRDMYPWLGLYARLKPGVTLQQARARMKVLTANLESAYPGSTKEWNPTLLSENRTRWPEANVRYFAAMLMAAGVSLLLITCTNIAGLLLARGSARQREIATRLALGASRGRIVRQLLAEGSALSILALIVSLAVYELALRALPAFENSYGAGLPFSIELDSRILVFAVCVGILATLMFGLSPALVASRTDLTGALKNQGILGVRQSRIRGRRAMVVFQMALTVILLTGAGLFIKTVWHFESIDPGFDRNTLVLGSDFTQSGGFEIGMEKAEKDASAFYRQSMQQIRSLPGIRAAAWAEDLLYDRRGYLGESISPDEPDRGRANWLDIHCNVITTGYFRTLGVPILQGRDFSEADFANPAGLVIVNETLARRYWPGQSPLGKHIRVKDHTPELCEVVGVAKDLRYGSPWEVVRPYAYFPYWQFPIYFHMDLYLSVAGNPMQAIDTIRNACATANPKVTMNNPRLLARQVSDLMSQERSTAQVLTVFGLLALILAAIGLYGIISYSVTQRSREFGIRIALGAQNGEILRHVIREGMILVALGLAIGLPCCLVLSRFVVSRMHGLSPLDPLVYALAPVLSFAVTLCAVIPPARRAIARPMNALRVE